MSLSRKIYNRKKKRATLVDKISTWFFHIAFSFEFIILFLFLFVTIWGWNVLDDFQRKRFLLVIVFFAFLIILFYIFLQDDKKESKEWHAKNDKSWGKGALGEEYIEKLLQNLPDNFLIINNFETNYHGDIDHIVIAPAGVFLIETKNTSGYYSSDGKNLLRNKKNVNYLRKLWKRMKYWRGAFKEFFNKDYFVPVYSRLVLLNTKWVDKTAFAIAKNWRIRICVGNYIIKNLLKYGKKPRLTPEQQHQVYDFIQLMNRKK